MRNKRMFLFEAARGFAAILLALAVAVIFIALCTDDVGGALEQMLLRPLFAKNGAFNANSLWVVLSRMIPTIFTGLAVCVMFSANQFNLAAEGSVMLGGFLATLGGHLCAHGSGAASCGVPSGRRGCGGAHDAAAGAPESEARAQARWFLP